MEVPRFDHQFQIISLKMISIPLDRVLSEQACQRNETRAIGRELAVIIDRMRRALCSEDRRVKHLSHVIVSAR